MQITLKQWKEIEALLKGVTRAVEHADCAIFAMYGEYHTAGHPLRETPEQRMLLDIWERVHELRTAIVFHDVHPQSEWMGGNSDNPKNHKLREPNCVPAPRRRFTDTEIEEAGAVCHGPVQWSFGDK